MKRIIALLSVLLILFSITACGALPSSTVERPSSASSDNAITIYTIDSEIEDVSTQTSDIEITDSISEDENPANFIADASDIEEVETAEEEPLLDEHGSYDSKDDVALYIIQYGHLPENYITKKEAQNLGWSGGSIEKYAPGKCIGGARFGNYEGLLPQKDGRTYTECDIDTLGASSRGAKRIVFSNDGLIFYTEDHYQTFELLYGEIEE